MKTLTVAAVVLAGTIGIGIGTAAQAGERNAAPKVPTVELGGVTYRIGIDTDASWQPQVALETGTLPATGDSALRGSGSRAAEKVATIESGGVTYRVGVDTGP